MTNYISVLEQLSTNLPLIEKRRSIRFADEIITRITIRKKNIEDATILIGYGGGKDSSWALAFLRYAQLQIYKKLRRTFKLRIITMVHLGTPRSTFDNIHKAYKSLGIYKDSLVESTLYSYGHLEKFSVDYKIPQKQQDLLKKDILFAGHRSFGDGRATFCFSCNFHMICSSVSEFCNNLDFIVTGDSSAELKSYYHWLQSILIKIKLPKLSSKLSFAENTNRVLRIGEEFYKNLYQTKRDVKGRTIRSIGVLKQPPEFLPIFDFTDYGCSHHWKFLNDFLGFQFTEEALNFTESDCRHPLLMAHLRGITAETQGRTYQDGIADYLQLAEQLMKQKEFHPKLIEDVLNRYSSKQKIEVMRLKSEEFAQSIGITEHNLRALVYSPVVNQAERLKEYIAATAPVFKGRFAEFIALLKGESDEYCTEKDFIEKRTGLNITDLRVLYSSTFASTPGGILKTLSLGDPHQKLITYKNKAGKAIKEVITGR